MRAIADAIPGARFREIADAGHLSAVEQPDRVSRAMIEFLSKAEDGSEPGR
jgi:pimeloyl-ACP methyl ester carboxylesterase